MKLYRAAVCAFWAQRRLFFDFGSPSLLDSESRRLQGGVGTADGRAAPPVVTAQPDGPDLLEPRPASRTHGAGSRPFQVVQATGGTSPWSAAQCRRSAPRSARLRIDSRRCAAEGMGPSAASRRQRVHLSKLFAERYPSRLYLITPARSERGLVLLSSDAQCVGRLYYRCNEQAKLAVLVISNLCSLQ